MRHTKADGAYKSVIFRTSNFSNRTLATLTIRFHFLTAHCPVDREKKSLPIRNRYVSSLPVSFRVYPHDKTCSLSGRTFYSFSGHVNTFPYGMWNGSLKESEAKKGLERITNEISKKKKKESLFAFKMTISLC